MTDPAAKPNLAYLDALRVLATGAVVILHVAARVVTHTPEINSIPWWIGNIFDSAVRWSVPMFVLISGALLLEPARREPAPEFYKKRLSRIVVPIIFWTLVYLAIRRLDGELPLKTVIQDLFYGAPFYHLWYLYMILGLYLFTPFLRTFMAGASEGEKRLLVVALFALAFTDLMANQVYRHPHTIVSMYLPYLGYFLAGHLLHSGTLPRTGKIAPAAAAALIGITVIAAMTGWIMATRGVNSRIALFFYDYLNPAVALTTLALFLLIKKIYEANLRVPGAITKITATVAPASLGIYLLHPLPLHYLTKYEMAATSFHPLASIPLISAGLFIGCLAVTRVLIQVPYLRKVVI